MLSLLRICEKLKGRARTRGIARLSLPGSGGAKPRLTSGGGAAAEEAHHPAAEPRRKKLTIRRRSRS